MKCALGGPLFAILSGCASEAPPNDISGFAGDYETIEFREQKGACGAPVAAPIRPEERWFRLSDEIYAGARLVGFRACTAPDTCPDIFDLARSVARGPDGYTLYVSSAGGDPCRLGYRLRRLERVDDTTVRFRVVLHQTIASELTGAGCESDVATERATSMPCVEERVWIARRR